MITLESSIYRNAHKGENPQDKYWQLINKSNSRSVTQRNAGLRSNTRSSNLSSSKAPRFYTYDKRNNSAESVSGGLVPGASSDLPGYKDAK